MTDMELPVRAGWRLLLFSDGLTESANVDGHQFGDDRILHALATSIGLSARESIHFVLEKAAGFRGDKPRSDDMTVIAFERDGELPIRYSAPASEQAEALRAGW